MPRTTAAIEIGNSVISLLWQLRCHCNLNHNKFSSFSDTTVVAIFPNLCLSWRSLCSSLGGIDPDKLKPPFKRSKIWGIRFSGYKRLSVFDEEDKLLCLFNCRNCHPVSLLFWFRLVFVLFRFVLAVSFRSFCWVPIPPAYKHIERRTPTGSDEAFVLMSRVDCTLGAGDFSSAVSGFCQVFIVTRAKRIGFPLISTLNRPFICLF